MKKNIKTMGLLALCLSVLVFVGYYGYSVISHNESNKTKTFEISKDELYLQIDITDGRYKVWLSRNGRLWDDYIEFEKERIRNHISNVYFFPPDSLYVLNIEGATISDLKSSDLLIIDVLSEDIAVLKDNVWTMADRLRYESNGRYVERFAPGSPRIAYRLTYDSVLCSAPVWISFEPYLKGFTVCDSTGHAVMFSHNLN